MAIKHITLFLRPGRTPGPALSVAASLARRHAAFLDACCLLEDPKLEVSDCYAIGPEAVSDVLERLDRTIAAEVKAAQDAFIEAVGTESPAAWSLSSPNEDPGRSARRALLSDLAIIGRSRTAPGADRALAEALALHSGAPCLIVPETQASVGDFDRIVIAWNGSAEAKRAMDDSIGLIRGASMVEVVTVGELAPDRREQDAQAVVAYLALHDVKAHARQLPQRGDAAAALLHCCGTIDADLLVMGAYSHARAAEAVLGGMTRKLLSSCPLPALMSC